MTDAQLSALSWAISEFEGANLEGEDILSHLSTLKEMYQTAVCDQYQWNTEKTALVRFMRKWRITIPHSEFDNWRMLPSEEQVPGVINGLPESKGIVRATNGILCYIEVYGGGFPYLGHYEFFVKEDGGPRYQVLTKSRGGRPKVEVVDSELEALFNSW
jgi:hypothetical protein